MYSANAEQEPSGQLQARCADIIKPVVDQLKGLVYQDDLQVTKVVSQKSLVYAGGAASSTASQVLTRALKSKDDFLHILVERD